MTVLAPRPALRRRSAAPPRQSPGWLLDAGVALLLLVLPFLYYWRLFAPNPLDQLTLAEGDFNIEFFPQIHAIGAIVRGGELPLWNPWSDGGQPLLADPQMAVFYPPNWVLPWLVTDLSGRSLVALEAHTILHLSLLGLFTYLLGRQVIGSRLGALVAALAFSFSGFMTGHPVQQVPIMRAAVWFPLLLCCLLRLMDTLSVRWAAATSLVLAIDVLAGHPQLLLFQLYGLLPFVALKCWWLRADRRALVQLLLFGALVGALAGGIAAVQLLPSFEFMSLSSRASSSYQFTRDGFSPFELLLDLAAPRINGGLAGYVGIATLALAALALRFARARWLPAFAATAALGALISLGGHSFSHSVLYLFAPGFALFQHQERAWYLAAFGLSVLAGYGAAWLAAGPTARQRLALARLLRPAIIGWVAVLALAALLYGGYLLVEGTPRAPRWREAIDWWNWFALMLGAVLALLGLWLVWPRGRRLLLALLPLLLILDLFTVGMGQGLQARPPDAVYVPSEIVRWLQRQAELYRLADRGVLNGNSGLVYLLPSINGAYGMFVARFTTLRDSLPADRLQQLLNVRYLTTREPPDGREVAVTEQWQDLTNRVLVLPDALPRASLVGSQRVASDQEALAMLRDPAFDPRQQVLVDRDFAAEPARPGGTASILKQTANSLEVEVRPDGAASLLLLSEIYYPGWHAYGWDRELPILRANYALRAVPLIGAQSGGTVRLVFEPDSLRWGALISAASLLIAAALLALGGRAGRSLIRLGNQAQQRTARR